MLQQGSRRHLLLLVLLPLLAVTAAWTGPFHYRNRQPPGCGTFLQVRTTPSEEERPSYPQPREIDEGMLGDLTGGRPGAIIETEEQLEAKQRIEQEISSGERSYPEYTNDYGELQELEDADFDIDDPNAMDAAELGTWGITDIRAKFPYEWDPNGDEPDPNIAELNQENTRYVEETAKNDDGVEVGYDPIFGPSSPIDRRTILGAKESYMISDETRDDKMLESQFQDGDPEIELNDEVVDLRKSLDIMETFVDPFLPDDIQVPRHVAKWHGYPERVFFEPKPYKNNRFTDNPTDFDSMTPHRARELAVEMARSKNAEWMPDGVSQAWHQDQRAPYEAYGTLVGTVRKGECDPDIVQAIQPALRVLGSCVDLLSIDGGVFRFYYHGLMKNRHGMKAWTETLLEDCGVEVTGVIFETGFRRRDPAYDGGDPWYGPSN